MRPLPTWRRQGSWPIGWYLDFTGELSCRPSLYTVCGTTLKHSHWCGCGCSNIQKLRSDTFFLILPFLYVSRLSVDQQTLIIHQNTVSYFLSKLSCGSDWSRWVSLWAWNLQQHNTPAAPWCPGSSVRASYALRAAAGFWLMVNLHDSILILSCKVVYDIISEAWQKIQESLFLQLSCTYLFFGIFIDIIVYTCY